MEKKAPIPAAVYVRRSCVRSNEKSCNDQTEMCLKKMSELGYFLAQKEFIYEDDVESGLLFYKRPALRKILDFLTAKIPMSEKPYEAIFIDDITRLARNLAFAIIFVQSLRFHKIKLFDSFGHEYTSVEGYALLLAVGMAAELNRNFLSSQTRRGILSARKRMNLPGKVFGYEPNHENETPRGSL